MTKFLGLCVGLLLIAGMAGCAMSLRSPVTGWAYTGTKGSENVTANPVASKMGKSCATSILGIAGYGDASVTTAANSAGITRISHVDTESFSVVGVYAQGCTIVYGE